MKQIFLISGLAQHGKDSTAMFLKQKLNGKSLIVHNADYLKYICKQYLNWDGTKNKESRTMLQKIGTEKIRIEFKKPLYWIEKVCDIIEIFYNEFDYFLIPDIRYENEIFLPKARFPNMVTTIRVNRIGFDNGLTEKQKNHISETSLNNFEFDYTIESKSGLKFLSKEVDTFLHWRFIDNAISD